MCPVCGGRLVWDSDENANEARTEYSEDDSAIVSYYHCANCGRDYEIADPCEEERKGEFAAYWDNIERDHVNPNGKWEFNEEVAKVFGDMLSRSIPNYDTMRELCFMVGRNFVKRDGRVADIGCSNGLASEKFIENFPYTRFVLSDVSEPMLAACREKYKDLQRVEVMCHDLRNGIFSKGYDLVISCLTLQFTPIEYRQQILQSVYDGLNKGGALILVEKVLGNSAAIDNVLVEEYYNIKRDNGYTEELIKNKRKSLEGVLVPLTASFNEHLLKQAGFSKIDCFWRCLNFCAWVAVK